ncbi:hypothetical protein CWATWH0402_885 [Crocosphaera watsonii WH 0402]|uniref:Uncharacterized protein n=2 Tax=Crocosphaera watsonii TaxID=263511 RepID=T2JGB8_CROWT|nr:hypothetical protein CWATWH0003_4634 [Crocosphaera watsonii WH 0003]CCQ64863.1 hypothetical protein CWATWH0402_885 [Crocosphaera watsonii WH 0402]
MDGFGSCLGFIGVELGLTETVEFSFCLGGCLITGVERGIG